MNTIIEKIRAEIERRKKRYQKDESGYGDGAFCEDVAILSFLSDLEKSEKPTLQEQPVELEKEVVKICHEYGLSITIRDATILARYYYSLGRQSKEQDNNKLGEIARHILAIKDHLVDMRLDDGEIELLKELGYPERKEQEQPVCEGLEEELKLYCKQYYNYNYPEQEYYDSSPIMPHIIATARHFAQWQKEQMMKKAVLGTIKHFNGFATLQSVVVPGKYKYGERVKLIIVKED